MEWGRERTLIKSKMKCIDPSDSSKFAGIEVLSAVLMRISAF
jgi:hypothetical protein